MSESPRLFMSPSLYHSQDFNASPFSLRARKEHRASLAARHLTQKCCSSASAYTFVFAKSAPFQQRHLTTARSDLSTGRHAELRFSRDEWPFQVPDPKHFEDAPSQQAPKHVLFGKQGPFQKNRHAKLNLRTLIQGLSHGIGKCNERKDGCAHRNSATPLTHQ